MFKPSRRATLFVSGLLALPQFWVGILRELSTESAGTLTISAIPQESDDQRHAIQVMGRTHDRNVHWTSLMLFQDVVGKETVSCSVDVNGSFVHGQAESQADRETLLIAIGTVSTGERVIATALLGPAHTI